mgnify:CR=1 FL=1
MPGLSEGFLGFNPTLVRFELMGAVEPGRERNCFNPTLVRFEPARITVSIPGYYSSFNPTLVRFELCFTGSDFVLVKSPFQSYFSPL